MLNIPFDVEGIVNGKWKWSRLLQVNFKCNGEAYGTEAVCQSHVSGKCCRTTICLADADACEFPLLSGLLGRFWGPCDLRCGFEFTTGVSLWSGIGGCSSFRLLITLLHKAVPSISSGGRSTFRKNSFFCSVNAHRTRVIKSFKEYPSREQLMNCSMVFMAVL